MNTIHGIRTCRKGLHQFSTSLKRCPDCKKEQERRWYEKNKEKKCTSSQLWRKANPEKHKENLRRWQNENKETVREYKRKRREENREKIREGNSWRRALKKKATPLWADRKAIRKIYAQAKRIEKETGIPHDVDHIYPLNSPYMCGLHVAENLQILTRFENISKGNRTWPGQLDCQKELNPKFLTET